jgi:hypothetical protein
MSKVPVVRVADLPDPAAGQRELTWFFGPALGEIEGGSSYTAMVGRIEVGGKARAHLAPPRADNGADRRVDALRAARTIYERLCMLPVARRRLLRSLFAPAGTGDVTLPAAVDAIEAYEDVRGSGPSVVPVNQEEV